MTKLSNDKVGVQNYDVNPGHPPTKPVDTHDMTGVNMNNVTPAHDMNYGHPRCVKDVTPTK